VHGPGGGAGGGGAMEAAVLDMVGEDAEGIQSVKGGYHWDKRHRKYVQLQPGEQLRAGKRMRAESGASVRASPLLPSPTPMSASSLPSYGAKSPAIPQDQPLPVQRSTAPDQDGFTIEFEKGSGGILKPGLPCWSRRVLGRL